MTRVGASDGGATEVTPSGETAGAPDEAPDESPVILAPHAVQNRVPSGIFAPHFTQYTMCPRHLIKQFGPKRAAVDHQFIRYR